MSALRRAQTGAPLLRETLHDKGSTYDGEFWQHFTQHYRANKPHIDEILPNEI